MTQVLNTVAAQAPQQQRFRIVHFLHHSLECVSGSLQRCAVVRCAQADDPAKLSQPIGLVVPRVPARTADNQATHAVANQ